MSDQISCCGFGTIAGAVLWALQCVYINTELIPYSYVFVIATWCCSKSAKSNLVKLLQICKLAIRSKKNGHVWNCGRSVCLDWLRGRIGLLVEVVAKSRSC